jgi:thiol-disulfide isomerase/thioredoxin
VDHTDYSVDSVDPEGKAIVVRVLGPSTPVLAPLVGLPAPDFSYMDVRGRPVRLSSLKGRAVIVYFWASRCGSCRAHADELRVLYERYDRSQLEILGVSYDHDRQAMEAFRSQHGHTWPTSFTGGYPAQDPVGRLYGETGSGVYYVVAPDGRLAAREYDLPSVTADLEKVLGSAGGTLGSRP